MADAALPRRQWARVGRALLSARPHPSNGWVRPAGAGAEDLPGRRERSIQQVRWHLSNPAAPSSRTDHAMLPGGAAGWLCEPTFFLALGWRMHVGEMAGDEMRSTRRSSALKGGGWMHVLRHRAAQWPRRARSRGGTFSRATGLFSATVRARGTSVRSCAGRVQPSCRSCHAPRDSAGFCRARSYEIETRSFVIEIH